MPKLIICYSMYIIGVLISAIAQLMLKKSASKKASINAFTFLEKHMPKLYAKYKGGKGFLARTVRRNEKLLIEYLNPFTMLSYVVFVAATLLTIVSYKVVPLSMAPILGTSEYFFVAILSRVFMKERINWQKALGLFVIVLGAVIYIVGKSLR